MEEIKDCTHFLCSKGYNYKMILFKVQSEIHKIIPVFMNLDNLSKTTGTVRWSTSDNYISGNLLAKVKGGSERSSSLDCDLLGSTFSNLESVHTSSD